MAVFAIPFAVSSCNLIADAGDPQYERSTGSTSSTTSGSSSAASSGSGDTHCLHTDTDPGNCGSCGHHCAVGDCAEGLCQPVDIVVSELGQLEYNNLVVDPQADGNVYFSQFRRPGVIFKTSKDPLSSVALMRVTPKSGSGYVWEMLGRGDRLYFSDFSSSDQNPERGVYSLSKVDGQLRLLGASGLFGVSGLQPVRDRLYFSTVYDQIGLGYFDVAGGSTVPLLTYDAAEPINQLNGSFEVDGDWIYFGEFSTGINRLNVETGERVTLYPGEPGNVVSATADALVWMVQDGMYRRGSIDGSAPVVDIAPAGKGGSTIVRDHVFYFPSDSKLERIALDDPDAQAEVIFEGENRIGSVAADSVSLYWLEFYSSRIRRMSF